MSAYNSAKRRASEINRRTFLQTLGMAGGSVVLATHLTFNSRGCCNVWQGGISAESSGTSSEVWRHLALCGP